MIHIPVFIIGGCIALAANEILNKNIKNKTLQENIDHDITKQHSSQVIETDDKVTDSAAVSDPNHNGGDNSTGTLSTEE